jgi:hypothetical protein
VSRQLNIQVYILEKWSGLGIYIWELSAERWYLKPQEEMGLPSERGKREKKLWEQCLYMLAKEETLVNNLNNLNHNLGIPLRPQEASSRCLYLTNSSLDI